MRVILIESFEFTDWVREYLTDEVPLALQRDHMNDPKIGVVMPGCGACGRSASPTQAGARGNGVGLV